MKSLDYVNGYCAGRQDGVYTLHEIAKALYERANEMEKGGANPAILELRCAASIVKSSMIAVHPSNKSLWDDIQNLDNEEWPPESDDPPAILDSWPPRDELGWRLKD